MPLETATYISELNASNPAHTDQISQADSHMQLIKATLLATFPNFTAAALDATQAELDAAASGVMSAGTVTAPGISVSGDANTGIYAPAADKLAITTGGVECVEFGSDQSVAMKAAASVAGALSVAAGVQFPATQAASANANCLDDYEEGTWTPGITFGGGATGLTYTSRLGTYTKIGRVVFIEGSVQINSQGSSTGDTLMTGLPFTVGGTVSSLVQIGAEGTGIDTSNEDSFYLYGQLIPGEDGVALVFNNDNGSDNLGEWFFQDGSIVTITGHYIV